MLIWSLFTEAAEYGEVTGPGLDIITFVMLSPGLVLSFGEDSNNMSYSKSGICKKCRCLHVCFDPKMRLRVELMKVFIQ